MDILDREANTREEAVQWTADMITEIQKSRAWIAKLEAAILAAFEELKNNSDHEAHMILKHAEWEISVRRAMLKHAAPTA